MNSCPVLLWCLAYDFLDCLVTCHYFFRVFLELSPAFMRLIGQKVHEVLSKQGSYADLSDAKILEYINSHSFDVSSRTLLPVTFILLIPLEE